LFTFHLKSLAQQKKKGLKNGILPKKVEKVARIKGIFLLPIA